MTTQTQIDINVQALMDRGKVVVPQFWLSGIEYRTHSKKYTLSPDEYTLSPVEYNSQMKLPTLAELRHAFETNNDYKQSVLSTRGYGEWTSTFLKDGNIAIENPENVVCRNGVWVIEGGKVSLVELPPNGWVLEYDKPTGLPSRTSQKRKDAENVFGYDTSDFLASKKMVSAILREFDPGDRGPFNVFACCKPTDSGIYIGGRTCRREDQN